MLQAQPPRDRCLLKKILIKCCESNLRQDNHSVPPQGGEHARVIADR